MMYPLKFKKHLVKKIWGGRAFERILDMRLPSNEKYGESWEVSAHMSGMSYVENGEFAGKSLRELIDIYGQELIGEKIYEKYRGEFPLLIKYLDIHDRLSVQVHPDDSYAMRVEGEFGKTESWYILEASEDVKIIMGIKDGITREVFRERSKIKDFKNMFNVISVKKDDFIKVKPGLVHATLEGSLLVCEIQQNSNSTYRIYDFDRKIDGEYRELHLDKAAEVIDFQQKPEISREDSRINIEFPWGKIQEILRGTHFSVDKISLDGEMTDDIYNNFKIYSCIHGYGEFLHNGDSYPFKKGDTYFIPASLEISICGKAEILKSYV